MTRYRNHAPPLDSPSKQLLLDLTRELEQVRLFDKELKLVHAFERKSYYENLDRIDQEREAVHTAALDEAAAFHDRVRGEAEELLEEHKRAEEEELRRKEEAARQERERIEREKAEQLRREQEEAARLEAERKAQEEQRKKAEAEAEKTRRAEQEKKEKEEREQREKEEADKRAQEEAAKKARLSAEEQARLDKHTEIGAQYLSAKELETHEKYLALHQTLKEFRAWMVDLGKQDSTTKQTMGNLRRSLRKSVGQLRDAKGANSVQGEQIRADLQNALQVAEPTVDVRRFFVDPPAEIAESEQKVPAMLIYGLNILSKALVSVLVNEAAIQPQHAQPVGLMAAQTFSLECFNYKGLPMSDILWAKFRKVCPALWGFTGNDKTEKGCETLGWFREEPDSPFIAEQVHYDRMNALGAGFASMTLRNFGKTIRRNPFPNTQWWHCMHKLISIPPNEMRDTHVILLQSIMRYNGPRIIEIFGQYGLAVMRRAAVTLPPLLGRNNMQIHQLKVLKDQYYRENRILV